MSDADALLATAITIAVLKLMLFVQKRVGPLITFVRKDEQRTDDDEEK